MKTLISSLFRALLAATVFVAASCDPSPTEDPVSPRKEKVSGGASADYPLDTTLTSDDGRTIEVTLTGRDENRVFFIRKADGLDLELEIGKLSPKDRLRMKKLPVHRPPDPEVMTRERKEEEKLRRYVSFREKEIERLERNLTDKKLEVASNANAPVAKRTQLNREVDALVHEIDVLKREIKAAEAGGNF